MSKICIISGGGRSAALLATLYSGVGHEVVICEPTAGTSGNTPKLMILDDVFALTPTHEISTAIGKVLADHKPHRNDRAYLKRKKGRA